ncbi:MAG: 30S ribosomal protein S17 [Candidatus Nealsonbacteria bacterium]
MKRILTGIITSNKSKDTIVVKVETIIKHAKYQRRYKSHKKYKAHAIGEFFIGDKVQIVECKPVSKDKKWKLVKVLVSAKKVDEIEEIDEEVLLDKEDKTKEKIEDKEDRIEEEIK